METYSNSEAFALLEKNPSLKFENKVGERTFTLFSEDNKVNMISDRGVFSGFLLGDRWTLKQEPVDFMTAINSGKRIKSEIVSVYHEPTWYLDVLTINSINGKWYIEEV